MAEPFEMPFEWQTHDGSGNRVLDGDTHRCSLSTVKNGSDAGCYFHYYTTCFILD